MNKANTNSPLTEATLDFARVHQADDTTRLLLSAKRFPDVDMASAVRQIEGLRTAQQKWPSLIQCSTFVYPPRLNCEQSSSEPTAAYKASLIGTAKRVADLTGGMGIDSLALATVASETHYVERDAVLASLAIHNFAALGRSNIEVHRADCLEWITNQPHFDLLLLDPARRNTAGRKVVAFADCSPDILGSLPLLLASGSRLMIKASPMIDIDLAVKQLGCVIDVHVVALEGECKEVLFICAKDYTELPRIHCVHLQPNNSPSIRMAPPFTRADESSLPANIATSVASFLYLPDPDLMKGGCFRLLSHWYPALPLDISTHIYTSATVIPDFPGRTFRVLQEVKLTRRAISTLIPMHQAHVITRNYPLSATELQRRLGLTEGGDLYIIATTAAGHHCGFLCSRL